MANAEPIDADALPEYVSLEKTGLCCEKGKVLKAIQKQCTISIREIKSLVKTSKIASARLEEIARAIEHPQTNKLYMMSEQGEWKKAIKIALNKINKHFEDVREAFGLLPWEVEEEIFKRTIYLPAKKRATKARLASERIDDLFEDLETHVDDHA